MLKIQQIFPKLYRCLLYVVFHNLKPQNAGLVDVKKDLNNKNKKSVKFQGDMLNFYDFIQVFVFTTNHHIVFVILHSLQCKIEGHAV